MRKTYTDKEIQKITGYSYAKLYELRVGRIKYGKQIKPILEQGKDWDLVLKNKKAVIVYYASGLRKLKK